MKVERQGPMECYLATVAALADIPLADVREYANFLVRDYGYRDWYDMVVNPRPGDWVSLGTAVARAAGGERLTGLFPPAEPVGAERLDPTATELPARGRGTVRFVVAGVAGAVGHIVPWENGLIYDPEDPTVGVTLGEYLVGHPRMRVAEIRVADEEDR